MCVCWWANEHEEQHAKALAPHLQQHFGVELVGVAEGSEPAELWELLGTDSAHARYPDKGCAARVVPRLFVCSVASGAFNVDEVSQFSQDDLEADDTIILDAHRTVPVWIGARSHPAEQKLAMDTAVDYCCVCAAKCDPQPPTPCAVPARGAVRGAHHVHHKLPWLAGQATGCSKELHPEPEQSANSTDTAQR